MQPPFIILYEDDYMLAIEKPNGIASVPAPSIPEEKTVQGMIRQWALKEKNCKPYLLNRLDFQTSGIILLGKYPRHRSELENIFKNPSTKKIYLALVGGILKNKQGTIKIPLEARHQNKKVPAITNYRVLQTFNNCSLAEVTIETGRKHQIRKHFAMIGNPLVMDSQYGDFQFNRKFKKISKFKKMFLCAWQIQFFHPFLKKNIAIKTELMPLAFIKGYAVK